MIQFSQLNTRPSLQAFMTSDIGKTLALPRIGAEPFSQLNSVALVRCIRPEAAFLAATQGHLGTSSDHAFSQLNFLANLMTLTHNNVHPAHLLTDLWSKCLAGPPRLSQVVT